jgi:cytochrome c biogenesis protein CcdA/thiol-disulfide isomerase/thioredoxin
MMETAWINIGLAFFEGIALIISPCILPILPIILSGSLTGKKSRPLGIIIGFVMTFALVTLFSKTIISLFHLNGETLRNSSLVILFLLGVMMVSTYLTEKFNLITQQLTQIGSSFGSINNTQSGFFSGLLFGGLVGIIWTPCAGPILAAVIVQVVVLQSTYASVLTLLAFAIGAGLPMLLIALMGRKVIDQFGFIRHHTELFRKLLGIIIIVSVIFLFLNSGTVPTLSRLSNAPITEIIPNSTSLMSGLDQSYQAPQIAGIAAWINSKPLQLSMLKNKVVLIDFWTYSCINCIRTLPYLKDWYAKYHDQGLVIIGIHSPEFEFEHNVDNVKNAVTKYGITYPVALDNNFVTWRNFKNQYWPAHYLINKNGDVVYVRFGEGEYDVTEHNIRYLLGLKEPVKTAIAENSYITKQTPEIYLGYARAQGFANQGEEIKNRSSIYMYPSILTEDSWALQGNWIVYADKIVAASAGAAIKLHFNAGKVYAVMGVTSGNKINVKLLLNGELLTQQKGADVSASQVAVGRYQLYSLINFHQENDNTLELIAASPGLEMYTFTFGN